MWELIEEEGEFKNMSCFSWRHFFLGRKYKKMTDQHTQRDFSKHWQREVKKMKKKRKKRNEEKQDLQKVQKRENRETIKIRTKKEKTAMKKEEKKKHQTKKWYIRKIMKKYFGWTSVGQVARYVEHCLWLPTRSSWQFACCGFQRAQLLSQFIWIRWTHVLLLSCLFWTRFPGCLFFKTCKCLEVRCVPWEQNCFLFAFFVAWSFCLHVTRVVSRPNHPAGSIFCAFFVVAALCFSFELNLRPYFAARGFLVALRGTCNAGVFFRSCWWHLAVSALSVCTPSSLPLRASCCPGLFCLMQLALFVSPAPPSGQGWCSLGRPWWILPSLSTSCWNPWGCEHRDGFWLGFFLPSLLPSAGCSFLPPDMVRASSLWHVLRILTLFLALTGTMALHVLKLDGVSASARHVWRDLMVSFICLYFCWPLLRFEVASVPGRF